MYRKKFRIWIQNCKIQIFLSTFLAWKFKCFGQNIFFPKFYIDFMDQKLILTPVCNNSSNKKISLRPRKSSVFAVLKITFLHSLPIPIAVINKEISKEFFACILFFTFLISRLNVNCQGFFLLMQLLPERFFFKVF